MCRYVERCILHAMMGKYIVGVPHYKHYYNNVMNRYDYCTMVTVQYLVINVYDHHTQMQVVSVIFL